MRHAYALTLILAACSYEPSPSGEVGVDAATIDNTPPDGPAQLVDSLDAAVLDAPPQVTCTTSDSTLALCLELEDEGTAVAIDGSGKNHDAQVVGATAFTRDVPATSRALTLSSISSMMVADSPDFDLQTLTISAWVRRTALPANNQRFGVVDVGRKQAALAIDAAGKVVCMVRTAADIWIGTGGATAVNEWSLVACTFADDELCMYVFKNGSATPTVQCGFTDGAPLDLSIASGGAIGALFDTSNQPVSKLIGAIDSIRIYKRALTAGELCSANGISGC